MPSSAGSAPNSSRGPPASLRRLTGPLPGPERAVLRTAGPVVTVVLHGGPDGDRAVRDREAGVRGLHARSETGSRKGVRSRAFGNEARAGRQAMPGRDPAVPDSLVGRAADGRPGVFRPGPEDERAEMPVSVRRELRAVPGRASQIRSDSQMASLVEARTDLRNARYPGAEAAPSSRARSRCPSSSVRNARIRSRNAGSASPSVRSWRA